LKQSYLSRVLSHMPEEKIAGHVLAFLNASQRTEDARVNDRINQAVDAVREKIQSQDVLEEVASLQEVFSLGKIVSAGQPVEAGRLLSDWSNRKKLWIYPWVLDLLLRHGGYTQQLEQEALSILSGAEAHRYNTYFFLALTLAGRYAETESQGRNHIPEQYLKDNVERYKEGLSAQVNMTVYSVLLQLDRENPSYLIELTNWQSIKLHKDHLQYFPELVRQGRYFLIFRDYFESMRLWGLRTEITSEHLYHILNVEPEVTKEDLQLWITGGSKVPDPIIVHENERVISAEYFRLGIFLLSPPNDRNPGLDSSRALFDQRAKDALAELLDIIVGLDRLPHQVKSLLDKYRESLFAQAVG